MLSGLKLAEALHASLDGAISSASASPSDLLPPECWVKVQLAVVGKTTILKSSMSSVPTSPGPGPCTQRPLCASCPSSSSSSLTLLRSISHQEQ